MIFVNRVSQLAAELLVVGITWWYTYRSYRIRKGVKLGKTISSLLFYNGELDLRLNPRLACLYDARMCRKHVLSVRFTSTILSVAGLIPKLTDVSQPCTSSISSSANDPYVYSTCVGIRIYPTHSVSLSRPGMWPNIWRFSSIRTSTSWILVPTSSPNK